jgi:dTDP-4-amino-4,6-dideoxygalactose transaminase
MLRLSKAFVGDEELKSLERVFKETVNFGLGIHVQEFEQAVQKYLETQADVIAVNTGTSALHIALEALSFPKGSEVLVPSITFAASHQAIFTAGLVPISCDSNLPSGHLSVADAQKRVTKNTVAIMPVSYTGVDFDRAAVYTLAEENDLRVIEDNAHAFGSLNEAGVKIGSSSDISCFSFDGIKNVTCGEGGAVVTADKSLAHKIRVMRSLGVEKDVELRYKGQRAWDYDISTPGFRYHMSNINAAIGVAQLAKINVSQQLKSSLYKEYLSEIELTGCPVTPTQKFYAEVNYHLFNVLLPKGVDRSKTRDLMSSFGFETGIHYAPNHLHTLFKSNYSLPFAEDFGRRTLSLPFHPGVTTLDAKNVIAALKKAIEGSSQ